MDEAKTNVTGEACRADEIRAGIEHTRAEMDETVNAIQAKFAPENIMDQAMQTVKQGATAASQKVLSVVKENPLPATLIGVGLIWLAVSKSWGSSDSEARPRRRKASHVRKVRAGSGGYGAYDPYDDSTAADTEGVLSHAAAKVKSVAGSATSGLRGVAGTATSKVGQYASAATGRAADLGARAWDASGRARDAASDMYDDYPLAVGAAALAVGMAAGFALPLSRRENQFLGPTRDQLVETAKAKGAEAIERGKEAAKRTLTTARDEAAGLADRATQSARGI